MKSFVYRVVPHLETLGMLVMASVLIGAFLGMMAGSFWVFFQWVTQ